MDKFFTHLLSIGRNSCPPSRLQKSHIQHYFLEDTFFKITRHQHHCQLLSEPCHPQSLVCSIDIMLFKMILLFVALVTATIWNSRFPSHERVDPTSGIRFGRSSLRNFMFKMYETAEDTSSGLAYDDGSYRCFSTQALRGPPVDDCKVVVEYLTTKIFAVEIKHDRCWSTRYGGCRAVVCADDEGLGNSVWRRNEGMKIAPLFTQCVANGTSGVYELEGSGLATWLVNF
ncbi:hypothetical protein BJ170DRAFT_724292 [Xylariales sp. AK1849]|nr:hypothetical protein BJ170DRAFT_724292 [Xylariales sp. AK1849]